MTSKQPTTTIEDYLQTIYSLQTEGETDRKSTRLNSSH